MNAESLIRQSSVLRCPGASLTTKLLVTLTQALACLFSSSPIHTVSRCSTSSFWSVIIVLMRVTTASSSYPVGLCEVRQPLGCPLPSSRGDLSLVGRELWCLWKLLTRRGSTQTDGLSVLFFLPFIPLSMDVCPQNPIPSKKLPLSH